jgi:hypothetical protein
LLLTLFVAVLCSIGVCTHWAVSVAVAIAVAIGGIAGKIAAGTRFGFVLGVVLVIQFLFWAGIVCAFLVWQFAFLVHWELRGLLSVVLVIAALIGGIVGGYSVRPLSK